MAAGIAALVKSIDPSILVIGVEPTGANKMAISLKTGRRVSLDKVFAVVISLVLQYVPSSLFCLDIICIM